MDIRVYHDDRIAAPATPATDRGAATGREPRRVRTRQPRPPAIRRRSRRHGGFGFVVRLTYWVSGLALLALVALGGVVAYYGQDLGASDTWEIPQRPPNIRVLAANGQVIANRGQTGGEAVGLHELPEYVGQAVIASEDRRFYSHFGVDPLGLVSVAVESVQSGRVTRGASTITQQVAKNLFLSPEQSLERKVQEALLAIWLERTYTKDQILELYLNRVHFGSGATGIEAAAQTYFGISARNLSLGQAAMLAGILPAPSTYNPRTYPERAIERQRLALANMVRAGFITTAQADAAMADPDAQVVAGGRSGAQHYVADWVETLMTAYLGEVAQDVVVTTTLDAGLQAHAERVLRTAVANEGPGAGFTQAALVIMDVEGQVRAMVGGTDYARSSYNRAVTARRQPGSAFKPFVYLTALQHGYTPDTLVVDGPFEHNGWSPKNSSGKFVGPILLRESLTYSLNTIPALLAIELGPEAVVETAYRMGISSPLQAVPSISLGSEEVSLLELTGAYAPFANGGYGVIPDVISQIATADGEILYSASEAGPGRILTDEQVGMMNDMLRSSVEVGTSRQAHFGQWPIGGKTGTSQRNRDALFVGYTAQYVGGVWLGNDDDSPTRAFGGQIPARIWREVMTTAHEGRPVVDLPGHYVRLHDRADTPTVLEFAQ
ncbi:transglycosylase domain-containing protein [Pelagibacterium lacus]|nr:PBP1A family penicillin-binding protein [Pelagibacterium lacus]